MKTWCRHGNVWRDGGASLAPSVWIRVYGREEMNCCVAKAVAMGPVAHFDLIALLRLNTLRWPEQKCCFLISPVLIMLLMERYGDCIFKIYLIPFRKSSIPYLLANAFCCYPFTDVGYIFTYILHLRLQFCAFCVMCVCVMYSSSFWRGDYFPYSF